MFELIDAFFADCLGILAGLLVLATFNTTNFWHLRILAVASNVAFIGYGVALTLWPVIVLHGLLLPLNLGHLFQLWCERSQRKDGLPALPPPARFRQRRPHGRAASRGRLHLAISPP